MPDGGTVTVRTENLLIEDEDVALYKTVPRGAYVVISVTDTGTGMPPEILTRVMEPFFTTKGEGKGTGLGLAMVYGFAKQSGGSVKLYSEVGHGTTVRLLFPASDQKVEDERAPTQRAADRHGTETVLVVDDRPDVAATAGTILEDFGYKVTIADGPKAALEILDGEARIDLLFTDLIMPGGMNGVMLARAARERAHRGDPDLHGREQLLGPLLQRQRRPRAPAALRRQLAQPRAAHRDQRDLGAGEDPVEQDQAEDDQEFFETYAHRYLHASKAAG